MGDRKRVRPKRIMIVDDSRVFRLVMRRSLRQAGFDTAGVLEVGTGALALEKATCEPLDLILADWDIVDMTGLELLEAIRERDIRVPFIFITAEACDELRGVAVAAGAQMVLKKPFTVPNLRRKLWALMR